MAFLRIFSGDTLIEQCELTGDRISIGRSADNDIVLPGKGVSKHHAWIERDGAYFILVDNGSANGTFVGKKRVGRHTLEYWDEITIVDHMLKFMAVARSQGEAAGMDEQVEEPLVDPEATTVFDPAVLAEFNQPRPKVIHPALLPVAGSRTLATRFVMEKPSITIGKESQADIRVGGFFSPRSAARLQRQNDGVYLVPLARRGVYLNGEKLHGQVRLNDGDRFKVNGVEMEYQYRPA